MADLQAKLRAWTQELNDCAVDDKIECPIEGVRDYQGDRDKENVQAKCRELNKLKMDIIKSRATAVELKKKKDRQKRLKEAVAALPSKAQDLTQQIELFETHMGLEVQHGPEKMKLIFSKVDRIDVDRKFIVCLSVLKDDKGKKVWSVAECKPALDDKVLSDLVEQLNSSDELSSFCKAIREQFCQLVS